jgi:hypothetical protein
MTPPQSPKKRPYQQHGQIALTKALKTVGNQDNWIEGLGEVGEALQAWKVALIEDLGGESEVSAMQLALIELSCKTHLLLASVDRFLLEQRSIVNKSRRALFPIVAQRQTLSDALAKYLGQLGLKKQRKPPASLTDYLSTKQDGSKERSEETTGGSVSSIRNTEEQT